MADGGGEQCYLLGHTWEQEGKEHRVHSPLCAVGGRSEDTKPTPAFFLIFVVSVNNIPWVFLCLFFSTAIFFRRLDQWQLLLQAGKHLE